MIKTWAATGIIVLVGAAFALAPPRAAYQAESDRNPSRGGEHLASFRSDADLIQFIERRRKAMGRRPTELTLSPAGEPSAAMPPPSDQKTRTTSDGASVGRSDRITNTQDANVDEGGIVKKRGDLLVVLRRGRLFTVSIANGRMRPIDHIDAFPPGVSADGDWYDEMLISGDRVIVIGIAMIAAEPRLIDFAFRAMGNFGSRMLIISGPTTIIRRETMPRA